MSASRCPWCGSQADGAGPADRATAANLTRERSAEFGRPTVRGEVAGPSEHDGMRFAVPADTVVVVLITRRGDTLSTSLLRRRGPHSLTFDEAYGAVAALVLDYLGLDRDADG